MKGTWSGRLFAAAVAVGVAVLASQSPSGQQQERWTGLLDEHPSIQYAVRPTTDRVGQLNGLFAQGERPPVRDSLSGYLLPVLQALGIPLESQLLVFSKTGVQRAYTSPHNPRALFYDRSVVVGYIPGAPLIELAAHDPQQGVVFYTVDQSASAPTVVRRTSCLSCHVSASTLDVPGIIARSNTVGDDGNVLPQQGGPFTVNHETPHPDRWGGWFITADPTSIPYAQRAHAGNITHSGQGVTSNQVLVEWMNSSPETRGYPSPLSDVVSMMMFDHQSHAINLLTRLNWESRVAASEGEVAPTGEVPRLVNELADYLLFVNEASLPVRLTPRPGLAEQLSARTPHDHQARSFAQFDLEKRLLRYPCSYMVYSEAFDGLPTATKMAVYHRMVAVLSGKDKAPKYGRLTADDRRAVLEILRDTKSDFPR
jgi:hypothetical protein